MLAQASVYVATQIGVSVAQPTWTCAHGAALVGADVVRADLLERHVPWLHLGGGLI